MSNTLTNLIDYLTCRAWCLYEPILRQMIHVVDRRRRGIRLDAAEIQRIAAVNPDKTTEPAEAEYRVDGYAVAIIPITGIIAKYSSMVNGQSQPRGTSVDTVRGLLHKAMDDKEVRSIFLRIESPGGYLDGVDDLAEEIYEASSVKPVIAFADDLAASAAYWIGSQATRFYANQTAEVGSIGVYSILIDSSQAAADAGLIFHIVRSGDNKGIGAVGVPITDEQLAAVQDLINGHHGTFVGAVQRGRGPRGPKPEALIDLADGRMFTAKAALRHGLIDAVMPLNEALAAARTGRKD